MGILRRHYHRGDVEDAVNCRTLLIQNGKGNILTMEFILKIFTHIYYLIFFIGSLHCVHQPFSNMINLTSILNYNG